MARLGEVCKKATSNIAQKDLKGHSGHYPIYGASGFIADVDFYQQENPYIAVVKDGAGIGRVMKLPAKSSVIGTMQYIIPNDTVDITFLAYAMEYMNLSKYFTGATIPHIYFKDYQKEELPLPPLDEQRKIAAVLDKVSDLIAKRRQQLSKLDEMVKARFVEMFGDLMINEREWKFSSLSKLCDVRDGTHDSPEYTDSGYPLLTSKNFTSGIIDFTDCNLISKEDFDKINQRSKVDVGDIVMPMIGTIGNPVIVNTEMPFAIKNVALIKFTGNHVSNIFIKQILDSEYFKQITSSANRGGTQKFVALGDIRKLLIPIVPLELQNQFADFVEQTEKTKTTVSLSLEKLETLKKALMQEYFG